ncbi:hypothetical protein T03_11636 [Trichinella britovi]|uniref:Uncharacterized protein n=1 Tax=Trichinella britovi TaxID=45882 RepID=A0A0V1CUT3_TRIBR|nr:hypothetical protein T09_4934 [Trichinella sp. T9]KRY52918.1 hypothetical protein T03_11636 [Trichinella britovi]
MSTDYQKAMQLAFRLAEILPGDHFRSERIRIKSAKDRNLNPWEGSNFVNRLFALVLHEQDEY